MRTSYFTAPPVNSDNTFRHRLVTRSPTFSMFLVDLMRPSILNENHS